MKNILKSNKKESGEIVLFVIFVILFFMLFIGLFLSKMILRQIKTANNVANSVQAYYIADSGTEMTLYRVRKDTTLPELVSGMDLTYTENPFYYMGGEYVAKITSIESSTLKIEVLGVCRQTSRAIELSWEN